MARTNCTARHHPSIATISTTAAFHLRKAAVCLSSARPTSGSFNGSWNIVDRLSSPRSQRSRRPAIARPQARDPYGLASGDRRDDSFWRARAWWLADRMLDGGSLTLDASHIVAIADRPIDGEPSPSVDCRGLTIVRPSMRTSTVLTASTRSTGPMRSRALPQSCRAASSPPFCPTTVACAPDALRHVLQQVRYGSHRAPPESARVIGAHLESNFINPDFSRCAACRLHPHVDLRGARCPSGKQRRRVLRHGGPP